MVVNVVQRHENRKADHSSDTEEYGEETQEGEQAYCIDARTLEIVERCPQEPFFPAIKSAFVSNGNAYPWTLPFPLIPSSKDDETSDLNKSNERSDLYGG